MMLKKISVIIIFHRRHNHLINVLKALESGREVPEEVILVEMDAVKLELPQFNLDINHCLITDFDPSSLPISKARNTGAKRAKFEILAFLDVDCIPSYDYISGIRSSKILPNAIYMAYPEYLTKSVENAQNFQFIKNAIKHPHRSDYKGTIETKDYGSFWSLCFFINAALFFEIGGFDENYSGYGAEDTDFAFKCKERNIPFYLTSDKVYHQPHSFMRPPINSFKSIVNNSNYFYSRWSIWPMTNHLEKFVKLGYIIWNSHQTVPITITKHPEGSELQKYLVSDEPFS